MKKIITYVVCVFWVGFLFAGSELDKARVTFPYGELVKLQDRVNELERSVVEKPTPPPVPVVVNSAEYDLDLLQPDNPICVARVSISNLSDVWQAVPVLDDLTVVTSIEPVDAKLVVKDGMLCALLKPKSELALELGIMLDEPSASRGTRTLATLSTVGAARSVLKVQHAFDPSVLSVEGSVVSNPEKTVFGLSAAGGLVLVNLSKAEALAPTLWRGNITTLVRSEQGRLLLESRIRLSATDNGRTTKAALQLPPMVDLRSLTSPNMAKPYRIEMSKAGPVISVEWEADEAMHRELTIEYTMPMTIGEEGLDVPRVTVDSIVDWSSTYWVMDFEGFSISPKGSNWLRTTRFPSWVKATSGVRKVYQYVDTNGQGLQIVAKALPRLRTADATITTAVYTTDVVAEGGMLHKAEVDVEHIAATRYLFTLPEQSKLLICQVNGRSAEPILMQSGTLSLDLPKASKSKTRVSYVYTTKGYEMDPVEGAAQMELPRTPLFINEVKWMVQLPDVYQATAIEGNVVIAGSGGGNGPVRLSKQICDDEAPYARLYYTRKDLDR
ncbi:MAG: hypothetical protein ACSHX8_15585 [Opitutaceae bacterium]